MDKRNPLKRRLLKEYLANRYSPLTEMKVQRWIIDETDNKILESASLEFFNELKAGPDAKSYHSLKKITKNIGLGSRAGRALNDKRTFGYAVILIILFFSAGGIFYLKKENGLTEVSVAYGELKYIFLPDSSEVWLNSGTTLRYFKDCNGDNRNVFLDGEAYFSVKHNKELPFIVKTKNLSIKVLGTRFNLKDYKNDDQAIATLASGKIEAEIIDSERFILLPNQQLSYNHQTSDVAVEEVDGNDTYNWINGQLIFDNESLESILQVIERRFDVYIVSEKDLPAWKETYTIRFIQNDSLEHILDVLSDVAGFIYERKDKNIIINGL